MLSSDRGASDIGTKLSILYTTRTEHIQHSIVLARSCLRSNHRKGLSPDPMSMLRSPCALTLYIIKLQVQLSISNACVGCLYKCN